MESVHYLRFESNRLNEMLFRIRYTFIHDEPNLYFLNAIVFASRMTLSFNLIIKSQNIRWKIKIDSKSPVNQFINEKKRRNMQFHWHHISLKVLNVSVRNRNRGGRLNYKGDMTRCCKCSLVCMYYVSVCSVVAVGKVGERKRFVMRICCH